MENRPDELLDQNTTPGAGSGLSEGDALYVQAAWGKRALNLVIDTIIMRYAVFFLAGSLGIGILPSLFFYVLYYAVCEATMGQTLGKLITGTKAVDGNGNLPTWGMAFGRSFARLVPFDGISYFFGDGQCWHDSWTDTYVIDLRKKPTDPM